MKTSDASWRSRRATPASSERVRRRRSPVASRSTTRPVNIAFTSGASSAACSGSMPSATRRCSMFSRHGAIWSARTAPGSPLAVASRAAASMPRRTTARLAGEAVIHRHHRRSRSASVSSGWRSSHCHSMCACTSAARASAATTSSSLAPKWWTRALTLTPTARAMGRSEMSARPCSARYATTRSRSACRRSTSGWRPMRCYARIRSPAGSNVGSVSRRAGRRWPMISISNVAPSRSSPAGT